MGKWQRRCISFAVALIVAGFINSLIVPPKNTPNYVSGVFVAPEWTSDANAQEWEAALKNMRDIGIDTIIVQYTYTNDSLYGTQAYFNYWKEDTISEAERYPMRRSQVAYILEAARKYGMRVYLGLQLAEREWFDEDSYADHEWLYQQYCLSADLANSLWNAFGETYGNVIAGWYLPFEFESTAEYYPYFDQLASVYYKNVTAYLKNDTRFGNLQIMISPLMYWADDKAAWQQNLITVLSGASIDIIAPQDGIGYGTQSHETVGDWYRATRNIVNFVNNIYVKNISLWANCENYSRLRNPRETDAIEWIKPMDISKFIDSMDTAAPYVDSLITFSIHRWETAMYNNHHLGVNKSYYEAYKRYYDTGARSAGVADGYYVSIRPAGETELIFNTYATGELTNGFAVNAGDWSEYKGISSPQNQPFIMEIRFDDPTEINSISSHYYQDIRAAIALPRQVKYEYLIRSGTNNQIFIYTLITTDLIWETGHNVLSSAVLDAPVMADGVRITVIPDGEWTFIDDIWVE